eukprot:jgi/Mesvir1/2015/Mv06197-RA.1
MASANAPHKKVLVPIADGTEEMEAVITIDVLRRAGIDVTVASCAQSKTVTASRGIKVTADQPIDACANTKFDLIALPGGMPGAEHLRDCATLASLLKSHVASTKPYAAICASPAVVLQSAGLLGANDRATAHPAFSPKLPNQSAVNERVVTDKLLTTSRGPGTAFEFGLQLVEVLLGADARQSVAKPLLLFSQEAAAAHKPYLCFNGGDSRVPFKGAAPHVLVPVANGTEEMEAVCIADVLVRAGAKVTLASVEEGLQVECSRKVLLLADVKIAECQGVEYDAIFLPGGMPGATHLKESATLMSILGAHAKAGKLYGAICASPAVALTPAGLLQGLKATVYPSFESSLLDKSAAGARVVSDGMCMTSQGPGTAMEFGLAIAERFFGPEKAAQVAAPMVLADGQWPYKSH